MFKSKLLYFVLVLLIVTGIVFYRTYHVQKANNEIAYLMQVSNGQSKLFGTLIITSGTPNSQDMANGFLCLDNGKNIEKVDLYMPAMGHGSEPPKVTPAAIPKEFAKYDKEGSNFACYSIESMQLFMPGSWQVRAFYKDGIMGIFSIDLKN